MAFLDLLPSFDGYNVPLLLLLLAAAIVFFRQLFAPHMDPREPPLLSPAIPIVGHLIGMMRNQMEYYAILR
jgi:hypothetical protein